MSPLGDTRFADDTYLSLLIRHEEAVAQLYSTFQETISADWDFWGKLTAEEHGHANMLRHVREKIAAGDVELDHRQVPMRDIRTSIEFIEKEIHQAKTGSISPEKALVLALRAESTMVERRFFKTFKTDVPEIVEAFERLQEQSQQHYLRIEKMAKNPPRRPAWMRTLFGSIQRRTQPKSEREGDS